MTVTRRQLRRDVLHDLGDIRILRATQNGTDVTFIDSNNLVGEVGVYAGRDLLITDGPLINVGQIRHITGSSSSQRSVGWGVALPAATTAGDEAEMVNTRGIGFRIQDIHDGINRAIRSIASQALVPTGSEELIYTRGDALAIPIEFETIENVQWQSSSDSALWHAIVKSSRANGHGWWVDPASRTVNITGNPAGTVSGRTVKLWGLAEPVELYDDADETNIDYEWLVMAIQAQLARSKHMRMPTPETERTMFMLSQQAVQMRPRAITGRGPFSVDLLT